MPELPEVETVRRGLTTLIAGQTIEAVTVLWPKIVSLAPDQSLADWTGALVGQTIRTIQRRGKYLWLDLDEGVLVFHLRMEGKCHVYPAGHAPDVTPKHVHLILTCRDGRQFHYEDVRKFGRFRYLPTDQLTDFWQAKGLGPEPVPDQFRLAPFKRGLAASKRAIKTLLLDQHLVAGLGNIYVDEVCFQARVHPASRACDLGPTAVARLHAAIIEILSAAVAAGGSTIRSYRNSLGEAGTYQEALAVYGRQDQPCLRCGRPIRKIQLGGRGTHFCAHCQRLAKRREPHA